MPVHLPPISRRKFLAGSLATGVGLLLPRSVWAADKADPNRWALVSDTHVWGDRDRVQRGVKSVEKFMLAGRQIAALDPLPAGMIIAGDFAAIEGKPDDYAVLAEEVGAIRKAGLPVHVALGNHDHRENFYAAFPEAVPEGKPTVADKHVSIVQSPLANWFLLDSLDVTNSTPGVLGEAQLQWLGKALDAHADKPALLVAHHPPLSFGANGLQDSEALYEVIVPRKHVKAFFFGHTHSWKIAKHEGIQLVNLPTTAWLFGKTQPRGWVDAKLGDGGATLVLNSLETEHPLHGETVELKWRV